jgi:hypothetical protein
MMAKRKIPIHSWNRTLGIQQIFCHLSEGAVNKMKREGE